MQKVDYRGLVNPTPGFPEPEQRRLIAKYEPSEVYVIDRGATHDTIISQQRRPRAIVVAHIALAARQRGKVLDRYANLLEFRDAIHDRGGHIRDASTGLRSDRRNEWEKMRAEARTVLGRIAKGAKSAINGRRGTPPLDYSNEQILTMLRIMGDRKRYRNWLMRSRAIRQHDIDPVPSRTWVYENLEYIARNRGLLK